MGTPCACFPREVLGWGVVMECVLCFAGPGSQTENARELSERRQGGKEFQKKMCGMWEVSQRP